VSGWSAEEVGTPHAPDGYGADEAFDNRCASCGGTTQASESWMRGRAERRRCFVTRFESLTAPSAHTVDATFALERRHDRAATIIEVDSANGIDTDGCSCRSSACVEAPPEVIVVTRRCIESARRDTARAA
jgi:hypothetical protein